MFAGLNNVTLDLNDANKVQINIEQLDFVKDMLRFIHKSENDKEIGKRRVCSCSNIQGNSLN